MMEFMLTMAVIAVIFLVATMVIALIAGGVMKAKGIMRKDNSESLGSE